MEQLAEADRQVEIERKKAEIAEIRAAAAKDRAEVTKQRLEAERLKLENEKLRIEVQKLKIEVALEMLQQIAPNLSEVDRVNYLLKLLRPTETLLLSELEISRD